MSLIKYILPLFVLTYLCDHFEKASINKDTTLAEINGKKQDKDTLRLYFPLKRLGQDSTENANALDTFTNVWYSRMLSAMEEPILANETDDIDVYRFTWLRTFHKPITVRIQKQNRDIFLTATILSGAGGYAPGEIIKDTVLPVTGEVWDKIQLRINQINFWSRPSETDFRGNDGAEWILEGTTTDTYHFMTRWAAHKSDYGKLCLYILSLSGIEIPKNEIY